MTKIITGAFYTCILIAAVLYACRVAAYFLPGSSAALIATNMGNAGLIIGLVAVILGYQLQVIKLQKQLKDARK